MQAAEGGPAGSQAALGKVDQVHRGPFPEAWKGSQGMNLDLNPEGFVVVSFFVLNDFVKVLRGCWERGGEQMRISAHFLSAVDSMGKISETKYF